MTRNALPNKESANQYQPTPPRQRVVAIDGKTVRGTVSSDGHYVHLLSAHDVATGITHAQVPPQNKGCEIGHFTPPMNQVDTVLGGLKDVIVVADTLHAQNAHARDLNARGAAPARHRESQPAHRASTAEKHSLERCHGRKPDPGAWTPPARDPHPQGRHPRHRDRLQFPHAAQAVRVTRTRIIQGKTTRETAYMIVTLSAENTGPADLNTWARQE